MKCQNKIIGNKGENIARHFLESQGYEIIQMNFNCKFGEVDIIAKKENRITFVEVKTRKQTIYGEPAESIDINKKKHIYRVSEYYTHIYDLYDVPLSLDVIEVYIMNNGKFEVNHIKNAIIEKPRNTFAGC